MVLKEIAERLNARFKSIWTERATELWTAAAIGGLLDSTATVAKHCDVDVDHVNAFHNCKLVTPRGAGEYLFDFCLTTLPYVFQYGEDEPWEGRSGKNRQFKMLLAAESEWGKEEGARANYCMVMDDFCKLLEARASFKVMVYGCHEFKSPDATALERDFVRLLNQHSGYDEKEKYLFFGVPWDANEVRVFTAEGERGKVTLTSRTEWIKEEVPPEAAGGT